MKKISTSLILVCSLILISYSCKEASKKVVETEPVAFKKEGELSIFKKESDSLLARIDIEFAEGEYETQTGLMYRESMENDQGMLFIFPESAYHAFYMKNTAFALDIVYIDDQLKVAHIIKNAQPFNEASLPSTVPVMYVLEINAGLSDTWDVAVGDRVSYQEN